MKRKLLAIASGLGLVASALSAQTGGGVGVGNGRGGVVNTGGFATQYYSPQQAGSLGTVLTPAAGRGIRLVQRGILGSPVSAREENKTVQTLGDGTLIETSDVTQFYRDSQGRTRTERTIDGKTTILIVNPVEGLRITLDPAAKTAVRIAAPGLLAGGRGGRRGGEPNPALAVNNNFNTVIQQGMLTAARRGNDNTQRKHEELGFQTQNGVLAEGTRDTTTIPAGAIGNNRDIHVVYERWYSKELQMMVKTINSDPRYGVTTYELTNLSHDAPDAGLFMIPAGYAISEQPPGAGRGATETVQPSGGGQVRGTVQSGGAAQAGKGGGK